MAKKKSKKNLRALLLLLLAGLIIIVVVAIGYRQIFGSKAASRCSTRLERLTERDCGGNEGTGAVAGTVDSGSRGCGPNCAGVIDEGGAGKSSERPTVGKNGICKEDNKLVAFCKQGLQCKGSPRGKCR